MSPQRSVLHLVREDVLPPELRGAGARDAIVFLGGTPAGPLPRCRLLSIGPSAGEVEEIGQDELLDLIFECDAVVTW